MILRLKRQLGTPYNVHLLKEVLGLTDRLSAEQRVTLAEHVLGRSSGLKVILANTITTTQVILQIQQMNSDQISDVLQAITERVKQITKIVGFSL